MDNLIIYRPNNNTLTVTPMDGRFNLTTSGGGNITQGEYDQIAGFVVSMEGAEPFLAKLRVRMER